MNWLDGSTAPKDGTQFLAYDRTENVMSVIYWRDYGNNDDRTWWHLSDPMGRAAWINVDAWMPLPDKPVYVAPEIPNQLDYKLTYERSSWLKT